MPFWINLTVSMLSLLIAGVSGIFLVPFLHKLKFGQPIKTEDGPQWHAKKQGTPTMGGFMFIIASVVTSMVGYWIYRLRGGMDVTSLAVQHSFYRLMSVIVFSVLFGLIGFIDDFTKVARKKNDGLSPMQKIAFQVIFSGIPLCAVQVRRRINKDRSWLLADAVTWNFLLYNHDSRNYLSYQCG